MQGVEEFIQEAQHLWRMHRPPLWWISRQRKEKLHNGHTRAQMQETCINSREPAKKGVMDEDARKVEEAVPAIR